MGKDFALLVDYKYCSGCHSCEIACKTEHDLDLGLYGIKVLEVSPMKVSDGYEHTLEWIYIPVPTGLCDGCKSRIDAGEKPTCVKHCQSFCLEYGSLDEMNSRAAELDHKVAVFLP